MFTSRILAFSLLATLASALPANITERAPDLRDLAEDKALSLVERATLPPVYSKCTTPNTVAITFGERWTIHLDTDIVNTLKQYNAKGTFFVNGNNYECIYSTANKQRVKTADNEGHQIASHTWGHLDRTTLSKEQLTAANGQDIVIWDFDSGDSVGKSARESKAEYDKVANQKPSTILTLNHETYEMTPHDVFLYALRKLQAKGYKFVTVAECLGRKNLYLTKTPAGKRDSTWKC